MSDTFVDIIGFSITLTSKIFAGTQPYGAGL